MFNYTENTNGLQPSDICNTGTVSAPPGRAEDGAASGTCIINNNVVVIRDIKTGRVGIVDNYKKFRAYMRRKIFAWAGVTADHQEDYGKTYALIQLSYADNSTWQAGDMTRYAQKVINSIGRESVYDYAFVMEVKPVSRLLHYHFAMHINSKVFVPYPDKSGMWSLGSTHIYRGVSSPYYLCKYVSKKYQKDGDEFPPGSRKYGVWLNKNYYQQEEINRVRRASYPHYVLDTIDRLGIENFSVSRAPVGSGGGWVLVCLDKLHDLYGVELGIASNFQVFVGDEVRIHFPDLYQLKQ